MRYRSVLQKSVTILFSSDARWRRELLMFRKSIDFSRRYQLVAPLVDTSKARMLSFARSEPDALLPTVRQLIRIGGRGEARALVEEVQDLKGGESAEWSLACAKSWYQLGEFPSGDQALKYAKQLAPEYVDVYEEEFHNQNFRGNSSIAAEAAERVLALTTDHSERVFWRMSLGEQKFKSHAYDEAASILGDIPDEDLSPRHRYLLAVSLEESGRVGEAEPVYSRLERALPDNVDVKQRRSVVHFENRNYGAVVKTAEVSPETIEMVVLSYFELFQFDRALETLRQVTAKRDTGYLRLLALALELVDEHHEAAMVYDELCATQGSKAATQQWRHLQWFRARSHWYAGHFEESAKAARAASEGKLLSFKKLDDEVDPRFAEWYSQLENCRRRNAPAEAREPLLALTRSASTAFNLHYLYGLLGRTELVLGEHAAAAKTFHLANPFKRAAIRDIRSDLAGALRNEEYAELQFSEIIAENTIVYEAFHGSRTSCNPLALCLRLLREDPENKWTHIWAISDEAPIHRELLNRPNVHFVRVHSLGYSLHLYTATHLINNSTFPQFYIRQHWQRYLNTWHGTPWKHMGGEVTNDPFGFGNVARNFVQATDIIVPNTHTGEVLMRTQDVVGASGAAPVITGYPRLDLTLAQSEEGLALLRSRLGIGADEKCVLYAPTWRGVMDSVEREMERVDELLAGLTELGVHVLMRAHHFVEASLSSRDLPDRVTIVPQDIDTNELLAVVDLLISDYSSIIFDFAALGRPIVKFVYDLEEYVESRGLYFPVDDTPGVSCMNPRETVRAVGEILDQPTVPSRSEDCPTSELWAHEDGHASERVLELLFADPSPEEQHRPQGKNVLLSIGGLNPNGITRSIRSLMATFNEDEVNVRLFVPQHVLNNTGVRDVAQELHAAAPFTINNGMQVATRLEKAAWAALRRNDYDSGAHAVEYVEPGMRRERQRYFGGISFDTVLDFDGYSPFAASFLSLGFPSSTKSALLLHSDFVKEMRSRFPTLRSVGKVLKHFDVLASVSERLASENSEALEKEFGVPREAHTVLPNAIDVSEIRSLAREPLDEDLKTWFERPGLPLVVLGRLSVEKNHRMLIDAISELDKAGKNVRAVFVGDGPRRQGLEEQTARLGLGEQIYFAGHRSNPYPALAASSALVLPSTHEGQPLVLLEAMTLGVPVIATDIPGSAAVLRDGEWGTLVPVTMEGLRTGIERFLAGDLPNATFDADAYLQEALQSFRALID